MDDGLRQNIIDNIESSVQEIECAIDDLKIQFDHLKSLNTDLYNLNSDVLNNKNDGEFELLIQLDDGTNVKYNYTSNNINKLEIQNESSITVKVSYE